MPDFEDIKNQTNGMLSVDAYRAIYQYAKNADPGLFVEVGTGHGAATIALGLGILDSEQPSHIHTFEKITGGTRERYGGFEENLEIIHDNFRTFNVDHLIELYPGPVRSEYDQFQSNTAEQNEDITLLLLDADGMIDRDFKLFYNDLQPGSSIILDDYEDRVKIKQHNDPKRLRIDLKHKLTFELTNFFMEEGILNQTELLTKTFFGEKPEERTESVDFSRFDIVNVYRKLIFTEGTKPSIIQRLRKRHKVFEWIYSFLRKCKYWILFKPSSQ